MKLPLGFGQSVSVLKRLCAPPLTFGPTDNELAPKLLSRSTDSKGLAKRPSSRPELLPARGNCWLTRGLKQARCEVFQVTAPGLPFVVGTGRLVKDVFDPAFIERRVQLLEAGLHPFGLVRSNTDP